MVEKHSSSKKVHRPLLTSIRGNQGRSLGNSMVIFMRRQRKRRRKGDEYGIR